MNTWMEGGPFPEAGSWVAGAPRMQVGGMRTALEKLGLSSSGTSK